MHTELPVVSFLCMGLLLLLSPIYLHTRNVAAISLAAWLVVCNLVHGVNALLWSGNDDVHVPAWCDIMSRVLLAAQIALPGCALAIARKLRQCAIGQEVTQRAHTYMQDLTFCLIIPLAYILLHVIVQPHRFDIITDFGCSASIYTSSVSLIIIWIPPLIVCSTTFAFAFLAIRARLDSGLVFFSHMQDSPRLNIFAFIRPLATSFLIAAISYATTIYAMYARISAIGGLKTWSTDTWSGVHAHMSEIFIVPSDSGIDRVRTEVEWWVVPASSFVLIVMMFLGLIGRATDDSSRGYQVLSRWFRTTILRRPVRDPIIFSSSSFPPQTLSSTPSSPTLVGDAKSLASEDVWNPVGAGPAKLKLANLAKLAIPERPQSSSTCASQEGDDAFVQSTLNYIESPTGREALGLPPFPPALYSPSRHQDDASPPPAIFLPPPAVSKDKDKARPSSILAAPWPRPPSTVPTSPRTPSPKSSITPINVQPPSPAPPGHATERPTSVLSLTTSMASSTISMSAYGSFYDDLEPHVVPFQDHLSDSEDAGPGLAVPRHVRKMRSRDMLPRGFSTGSRKGRRQGSDGLSGGIHMTVVKEMV
ncbi:STE3-domain-containing protein [Lentinus tigrinus ALCF2SS1-7]|uniref:STE3-domain-containing protein n=1 Tax=Lentinus tigrinus ALCF2SS1-7 TaxID=1328758 RepID=UPI001165E39D|nr:STE3-domain-containing protein [Lentinus tigrinus ALCF2SS1-7]